MHFHRTICMRHWNAQQPGGQGLASEFDLYFKVLSTEAKEVLSPTNVHRSQLIILYSTHSRSRKSHVLPKAQQYVLVFIEWLTLTETTSQRKATKLAMKAGIVQSIK